MTPAEINEYREFMRDLASAAAASIMPHFRGPMDVEDKGGKTESDPVTIADKGAEKAIRDAIKQRYPDHGIIGEEYDATNPDASLTWVIDPIDGTKSFVAGLTGWGTLIGLTANSAPVLGLMHQPFLVETFEGDGASAQYFGRTGHGPLKVRDCGDLGNAILATTSPNLLGSDDNLARFQSVEDKVKLTRYGGDCYSYCMLAAGHIDLVIEAGLNQFDIAALIPIIEGAGGIVTSWSGESAALGGTVIAAGNRKVHDQALSILNG